MNDGDDGGVQEQDAEVDQDHVSFEDSDRFEEDSICSYLSETESVCNHWRGWKKDDVPASRRLARPPLLNGIEVPSLVEFAARQVASSCPFELVDKHNPPVPEQLQKRIAFWSFPENEEDIRLYSCLANGNDEEFQKGEQLFRDNLVKNLLQIGLHLSASVVPPRAPTLKVPSAATVQFNQPAPEFSVAITFDRNRITSCSCTCKTATTKTWCAHVVAVCLHRIYRSDQVSLRAPLSESLSRLDHRQLWKFAQYFIDQLPRQVLPAAQQLLDELLTSNSVINQTDETPDPTSESGLDEQSGWCLDEGALHENIRNLLVKFCIPSPMVCSDVNYLTSSAPPAATEWSILLRPLRGREPEGMWNLLSIIREMFKRSDSNAIPMLAIMTDECLACEQVVVWWFSSRIPQTHANHNSHRAGGNGISTTASQHASASLMDEVVALWKLAVLNPGNTEQDRMELDDQLKEYHSKCIEKVSKSKSQNQNGQHVGLGGNNISSLRQTDIDIFLGFKPAIEACAVDWKDCQALEPSNIRTVRGRSQRKLSHLDSVSHPQPQIQGTHSVCLNLDPPQASSSGSPAFAFGNSDSQDTDLKSSSQESGKTGKIEIDRFLQSTKKQDLLFMRAEAFYAHGYFNEAFSLAVDLAQEMLTHPPMLELSEFDFEYQDGHVNLKQRRRFVHQLTQLTSATLTKITFLVKVLSESPIHHYTAFLIGLYGIELVREPASTKAFEVRISFQESELLSLLKKIPINSQMLTVVRQRAKALRDKQIYSRGDALLPLNLANFIFETLCCPSSDNQLKSTRDKSDDILGFEAAVVALGLKAHVSEAEFPLVCEGTRRLRSDLACSLLVTFKDDPAKLTRIMDSLLDKEIFINGSNGSGPLRLPCKAPLGPQMETPAVKLAGARTVPPHDNESVPRVGRNLTQDLNLSASAINPDKANHLKSAADSEDSSALEEDNKDWESKLRCTVFKTKQRRGEAIGNIDSSPPETTSSDNSPTVVRRHVRSASKQTGGVESDNGSSGDSSSDSRDSSFRREDDGVVIVPVVKQLIGPMEALARSSTPCTNFKSSRAKARRLPTEPNQPSEALAYSLFELAKVVLAKAGGTVNSVQFQPAWRQNQSGTHQGLHMCAFRIGFYALGIENCISNNWQSRQYSTHGSWVEAQAIEIGASALTFLIEKWEGHFTPSEVTLLADKVSRSSEMRMVRVAAELAKSVLPHSHALKRESIQRALNQCKEQNHRMLEEALISVENAANGLGVFPLALFDVARHWYALYAEIVGEAPLLNEGHQEPAVFSNNQPDIHQSPFMTLPYAMQLAQLTYHPHMPRHHHGIMGMHPHDRLQQHYNNSPYYQPGVIMQPQAVPALPLPIPSMTLPQFPGLHHFVWNHLESAYRVGMLAMDTLGKRAQDDQRNRYARNPPYGEPVKWLLGVTLKLNSMYPGRLYLHRFVQNVQFVVSSPYVLWEIAVEAAQYLSGGNFSIIGMQLRLPFLNQLITKSFHMFALSISLKIQGIGPSDEEEFISTVCAAQAVSNLFQGGSAAFHQLLHHDIRKSKFCKRDLWDKISAKLSLIGSYGLNGQNS